MQGSHFVWATQVVKQATPEQRNLWVRFTTPHDPPPGASFEQQDIARRALIASAEAFFLLCTVVLAGLIGIVGPNKQILEIVIPVVICMMIACLCNRHGHVNIAGLFISGGLTASMTYSMLTAPGGLSVLDTQILFLIVFSDIFFVAIMPLPFFFVPAVVNLGISLFVLSLAHHSPPLNAMLTYGSVPTFTRLLQIHLVFTGAPAILVYIMRRLIKQANQAMVAMSLQHHKLQEAYTQIQTQQQQLVAKAAIEQDTQVVIRVLTAISKKQFGERVPLDQIHNLKLVAGQLNALLGRHERLTVDAALAEATRQQTPLLLEHIEQAIGQQRIFSAAKTSTLFDPLLLHLNGKRIVPASALAPAHRVQEEHPGGGVLL
jgi:hypothetical protein